MANEYNIYLDVCCLNCLIQHFSPSYGDHTQERHQWLGKLTLESILAEMQKHKESDVEDKFEEVIEQSGSEYSSCQEASLIGSLLF